MMDDWNGRGWVNGRHVIVFDSRGHHERQPPLLLRACKFNGRHHRWGRDVAILVLVAVGAPAMVGLVRLHQSRRAYSRISPKLRMPIRQQPGGFPKAL